MSERSKNLVEIVRNVVEGILEVATQARHGADGGNRDQGGDQAIFDGGRALLVGKNLANELHFGLLGLKLQLTRLAVLQASVPRSRGSGLIKV